MSDFTNAGNEIGGFLGGVVNPVLGGTTETTVTSKPAASSNTTTIIVIVVVVAIIGIVGFIVMKRKR